MSAATTASPAVVRNSSRRQPSHASPTTERHHRTPSSSRQSTQQSESRRSTSNPPSHARGPSMSQQQGLAGVARRDYEQTNVARPHGTRRSTSRDGSYNTASQRTESSRGPHRSDSRHGQSRYSSDVNRQPSSSHAPQQQMRARPEGSSLQPGTHDSTRVRRHTTVTATTGIWSLGKTIGAGSMGKVKLARNTETGEQVS